MAKRRRNPPKRRARRNPSMPVVLVNPSGGRRKKRRNPRPSARVTRRRNASQKRRRRNPYGRRRRSNPRSPKWTDAMMCTGIGLLGGGIAYGINWGLAYAPLDATWGAVAFGAGGAATSVLLAKYADERVACGLAGGVGALLFGRVREIIALRKATPAGATDAGAVYARRYSGIGGRPLETGAVYERQAGPYGGPGRREAGAVVPVRSLKDAGAIVGRRAGAPSMSNVNMQPNDSFKVAEAGASRYIPGGARWFGPRSWAYDAGRVRRVSAHNVGRY